MYAILFIIITLLIIAGLIYLYMYALGSPLRISSADAKRRIRNGQIDVILDVRTDLERKTLGYYPGSVHLQSADLARKMPEMFPDKNIRILVYCNTGQRARAATEKLVALGYPQSRYIIDGYKALL